MTLTRKRQKELNKLKSQAQDLWDDQRELLDNATHVVNEARRQASNYAREEVSPRVRDTYDHKVRPVVDGAAGAVRGAAQGTRDKIVGDVLPTVTSALGAALATIEVAKNQQLRHAIARGQGFIGDVGRNAADFGHDVQRNASRFGQDVQKNATRFGQQVGVIEKPKAGAGKYILIGLGVVAAAAVAYAAWQTLRADDDLWIDDEDPELAAGENISHSDNS